MQSIQKQGNKFIGMINGREVVRSSSEYYVKRRLAMAGTGEMESPATTMAAMAQADETPINKRFDFVSQLVKMVAKGATPSAVITGEGGLGKTYTVIKALDEAGLRDVTTLEAGEVAGPGKTYRVVKGFSTAKGMYRTLAENSEGLVIFDDCDSVLRDPNALNVLKGALDSFGRRVISWNTSRDDDDIPRWFEFKGQIIFITNMAIENVEQALRSRSMCVDLSMTVAQKVDRMAVIARSPEFLPNIEGIYKEMALQLIDRLKETAADLTLRSLIKTTKIAATGDENWEELAKYMLIQG